MNLRDVGVFIRPCWESHDNYISYIEFPLPLSFNRARCPIDVCMYEGCNYTGGVVDSLYINSGQCPIGGVGANLTL